MAAVGDDRPAVEVARAIVDSNLYMTLATADPGGRPWASPVYYARVDYRQFVWVSSPDARHSQNLSGRPDISIVVFDSTVPINSGQAVYMSAVAELVPDMDLDRYLAMFSRSSEDRGGGPWS